MIPFAFLLLLSLWSLIHLTHRFYAPSFKSRSLLPTSLTSRKRNLTTVTLKGVYLRVESTALNYAHDILAQWLSRNRAVHFRTILRSTFDLGIMISLLGMAVALALLAWTFVQLARRLVVGSVPQSTDVYLRVKRVYESNYVPPLHTTRATTDLPVQLLIPGVTLPLSQLPLLISALFFSQTIHEAGHALSAALDHVPLQCLGASLTLLVPAAFVAFPTQALASLSPHVRARIAASGPLLSALLYLILILPLERPFLLVGYSSVTASGLIVASVTLDSPLASHLTPGTLLTALDDFPLANAKEGAWSDYLTASQSSFSKEPAWCVDTNWFLSEGDSAEVP
ncbi:hypothetical protein B0F90DRAFT_454255 [Multifurca ochricompacta]|uniref:Endopeptidase S2P n=1 Tax=Multifurca ochricompacta TaxID=376703 RepID=A0AAD4M4G1_9AGAM|nr:hypothetical protein B0F90DRAFT_454255 [Multifurca ochricompacta]